MQWLISLLHSLPHLNFTFSPTPPLFIPSDLQYIQSLIFYSSIPLALALLLLFILSIIWCIHCCQSKPRSKRLSKISRYSSILFLLDLICCIFLGLCLFSNEKIDRGATSLEDSILSISSKASIAQKRVLVLNNSYEQVSKDISSLHDQVFNVISPHLNNSLIAKLAAQFRGMNEAVQNSMQSLKPVENVTIGFSQLNVTSAYIGRVEFERWSITLVLFSLMIAVLFIGLVGFCRRSLSTSILFSASALMVFILDFCIISLAFGTAIGISDLCSDPHPFLLDELSSDDLSRDSIMFYTKECQKGSLNPIFEVEKTLAENTYKVKNSLDQIQAELSSVARDKEEIIAKTNKDLDSTLKELGRLLGVFECPLVQREYRKIESALCEHIMGGVSLLLLGSISSGVFLFVVLIMLTNTWDLYKPKQTDTQERERLLTNEERGTTADYYGHGYNPRGRGADNSMRERSSGDAPLWIRSEPPPAYEQVNEARARRNQEHYRLAANDLRP